MAFPQHAYRDPSRIVESDQLHRMGCAGCSRSELILGKYLCPNALKYPACRTDPRKGYKVSAAAGGDL
jgi:hypothetical protein